MFLLKLCSRCHIAPQRPKVSLLRAVLCRLYARASWLKYGQMTPEQKMKDSARSYANTYKRACSMPVTRRISILAVAFQLAFQPFS